MRAPLPRAMPLLAGLPARTMSAGVASMVVVPIGPALIGGLPMGDRPCRVGVGSQRLGPQCDPQFCKAQRNKETTFLRLGFRASGAGDEGELDLSQETLLCSGICQG
ncbi:hypothetical protein BHE74_00045254 [Ensete ventricosum]|nr:hypothetical protein BHE74_00045254 [Ensete ventricosum]RZS12054.1 hypothetical protein BHM03_00043476 [Ensete ventricosum]